MGCDGAIDRLHGIRCAHRRSNYWYGLVECDVDLGVLCAFLLPRWGIKWFLRSDASNIVDGF